MDGPPDDTTVSRRAYLTAAASGVTVGLSGCIRQTRSAINRDRLTQLSLTITSHPADGDRHEIQLARRFAENLEAVGIDVSIATRSNEEYLRDLLINHEYDLYVGTHPASPDPDFLYETLHSRYAEERGWQNPFGFAHMGIDELLEAQRERDGEDRREAVADLLEDVAREQPFIPICRPEELRLARTARFTGWDERTLATRVGYLGLEPASETTQLRGVVIDARPSKNLNPLSAEYRNRGLLVELVYDSLATADRDGSGDLLPWLAETWETAVGDGDEPTTLEVTLREDVTFHDGVALTADDVAFTYEFLADTTLGGADVPAPTPRYRGLSAAVEAVEVHDDRSLTLETTVGEAVSERALTVPVLPAHIWRERATAATVPGWQVAQGTTDALVTDNVPAIGSGPFAFGSRNEREHVTFERFDEHFTTREDVDLPEVTVEQFRVQIDPRSASAIALIESDDADITVSTLEVNAIGQIGDSEETELLQAPSHTFYHVGFNARRAPFGNPLFRRAVTGLLDKSWLVEDVFEGYAEPVATPVLEEWVPESLRYDGVDPEVPFYGSDGRLDVDAAREAFRAAGFQYDGDALVVST